VDHPELAFGEDGDVVSVWVGEFGDQDAVDSYTEEQYDEDREDEPISKFGEDIGLKFYDHDFMEVEHYCGLSELGVSAFARHSYGESFGKVAWQAALSRGLREFDTVFMLYGYDHVRYPQANRTPERVKFVGTFPCTKTRDEWFERLIAGEFDNPKQGSS
jgi:hypothetical protein